ncbi:ketopantoate reductase family protein [Lutimonas zeaxanthinifaciens]|uniref:ketopantoate reductase family protein n=1 Tax=Lutimonas zeaxanthinifaciens TaxID=3060215 RepID=UPI00265D38AC|nr:2-dehydropantoate 2-reductase [Lutimonas sp. YSD2104]WKK67474.1 2-dehydropantoate 2-reductase [Lutimonas sp. YSD2104]
MNIVIIGVGGVGGYFGGKLALAGHSTTFIARGATFQALKQKGLEVKSIKGDFHINPKVEDNFDSIRNCELVLLCVKSWQIESIARQIKPLLPVHATVLPLQNGADNAERLLRILNKRNLIAGLCRIVSKIESPGVIDHFSYEPEIVFGEIDHELSERVKKIKTAFDKAGFKNRISENIQRDIWIKFLFIASISAAGALTRSVLGIMREDPYLRGILIKTAEEIISIGQRLGVELHKEDLEQCFKIIDKIDYCTTMSLQRDMMEGRPSELENFNGFIVKKGDELGIETPVNDFIYYSLRPMELKAREKTKR